MLVKLIHAYEIEDRLLRRNRVTLCRHLQRAHTLNLLSRREDLSIWIHSRLLGVWCSSQRKNTIYKRFRAPLRFVAAADLCREKYCCPHLAVILYRERRNAPVPGSPCCTGARLPAELASQSMANGSAVMAKEGMRVHRAWMGGGGWGIGG